MERTLDLHYDEIVIGADLSALLYSYYNKIPILYIRHVKPYFYVDESNHEKQLKLWQYLMFMLSFNGLCPFSNMVQTIRLEDINKLKVATKNNSMVNLSFNKLIVSDDYLLEGFPNPINKTSTNNLVVDFMAICQRNKHYSEIPEIKKDGNVFFDVNFTGKYLSDRKHTSVICKSYMDDKELLQEEYNESYMRIRFLRSTYPNIKEVKHLRREIYSFGKNIYESENIVSLNNSFLEAEIKQDLIFDKIERALNGTDYKEQRKSGTSCWGNSSRSTTS